MIDRAAVQHLGVLARLHVEANQADRFAAELTRVLAYVDQLTTMEAPVGVTIVGSPRRMDEPAPPAAAGLVAASAGHDGTFVRVPKVLASE